MTLSGRSARKSGSENGDRSLSNSDPPLIPSRTRAHKMACTSGGSLRALRFHLQWFLLNCTDVSLQSSEVLKAQNGEYRMIFPKVPADITAQSAKVKTGSLWGKNKEDLLKQLGEFKTELNALRTQKIVGGGNTKLTKLYVST